MQSAFEPPTSEIVNAGNKKPRNIVVTILLSLFAGPFIAMLYLARPIRFVVYTGIILYSTLFKPFLGIEFLGETDLLDSISYLVIVLIGTIDAILICRKIPLDKKMPLYSRWYVLVPAIVVLVFLLFFSRIVLVEPFTIPANSMRPNYLTGDMVYLDKRKSSMLTTHGQVLHRFKNTKSIELAKRGNVVIYLPNEKDELFLGRIVGMPGEKIEFYGHHFDISRCIENECVKVESNFVELNDASLMMGGQKGRPVVMGRLFQETIGDTSHQIIHSYESNPKTIELLKHQVVVIPKGHVLIMGDNRDNSLDSRFTGTVPVSNIAGELF